MAESILTVPTDLTDEVAMRIFLQRLVDEVNKAKQ